MEKLVAMMAFCEAPMDGTVAPPGAASATGGCSNVVSLLDAATKNRPMEKLVATMAFCEAPLDGTFDGTTSALPSGAAGYGYPSAPGGGNVVMFLAAAAKYPMEKLVATMAFCEAPFEGTFDGTTTAPSSGAARGDRASGTGTNVPGDGAGEEDAAALRRAWLADARKEWPLREHPLLLREKAASVFDGLAIFETVALQ